MGASFAMPGSPRGASVQAGPGDVALNRTKIREAAQKLVSRQQYAKAIAEYQKLVDEDPRDVRTLLKIGDLHTRRQSISDAVATYARVAREYSGQGFFLKAVAVYKQILKLDPNLQEASEELARMYEELALHKDALGVYEHLIRSYQKAGNNEKAIETMGRMVQLDPTNIAVRIKHAETLSKAGMKEAAAQAFAQSAGLLRDQGRMDDYLRVAERLLYHQTSNTDLARELASLYLERRDPQRALAKLQICFQAMPKDVATLEMLASAFSQLRQDAKTLSVLTEVLRLQKETGDTEGRRRFF